MSEPDRLDTLLCALRKFNLERDWGQFHNPRNLAMALAVEAGELLELFLWSEDQGPQPPSEKRQQALPEELADVLLTLLNLADRCGVDLIAASHEKLARNAQKYPVELARSCALRHDELIDKE